MRGENRLFLHEEIILLALRDKKGTIDPLTHYKFAIGGAVLAELLLRGRVEVDHVKKKRFVALVDSTPVGDPVIDECIEKLRKSKRRARTETWVSRFAGVKNLRRHIAAQLCQRGILREAEGKVLFVFTRKTYPELNPEPEKRIISRLREAVFTETENVEPRTVVLVSLAKAANLLRLVFDKKQLKGRKERIKSLIDGELTGEATKRAIDAMHAAVTVACVISTIS